MHRKCWLLAHFRRRPFYNLFVFNVPYRSESRKLFVINESGRWGVGGTGWGLFVGACAEGLDGEHEAIVRASLAIMCKHQRGG